MTIVIKVGSQPLLKRNENGLDQAFMANLVEQLAHLKQQGHSIYLISSGAVAAGRMIWHAASRPGAEPDEPSETARLQILAGLGQVELMHIYKQLAGQHGLHAVQLLLSKNDFISRAHYLHVERLLLSMQSFPELLPVINENDSVSVEELMFTDNDQLAGVLAQQLGADLLMLLTEVAGVYDREPCRDGAQLLPLLGPDAGSWSRLTNLTGKSHSGRGGINSKLETARKASRAGVPCSITAAREPQVVLRVVTELQHLCSAFSAQEAAQTEILAQKLLWQWTQKWSARTELGTLALPALAALQPWARRVQSGCGSAGSSGVNQGDKQAGRNKTPGLRGVRKWLSARQLADGQARITVNSVLAQKLQKRERALSILPVGIVSFQGTFSKGDLIDIYSEPGKKIGIGLARYSDLQLSKTMQRQNQAVFIHYNYLHIEEQV